jgi:hypothetical protein
LHGDGVGPAGIQSVLGVPTAIKNGHTRTAITIELVDRFGLGRGARRGAIVHRVHLGEGTSPAGIEIENALGFGEGRKKSDTKGQN